RCKIASSARGTRSLFRCRSPQTSASQTATLLSIFDQKVLSNLMPPDSCFASSEIFLHLSKLSWGLGSNGTENRLKHRLSAVARSSRCKHRTSWRGPLHTFPRPAGLTFRDGRTALPASWPPSGLEADAYSA